MHLNKTAILEQCPERLRDRIAFVDTLVGVLYVSPLSSIRGRPIEQVTYDLSGHASRLDNVPEIIDVIVRMIGGDNDNRTAVIHNEYVARNLVRITSVQGWLYKPKSKEKILNDSSEEYKIDMKAIAVPTYFNLSTEF